MLVWCWEGMIMFQLGDSFIDITGVHSSELLVNSLVGRWKLFLSIVPYQHFLKTSLWLAHDDLSCLDLTAKYLFNRQQNNSMTSNFKTEPHCGFAWSTTETNMLCILGLSLYQKGPIPQIGIELTANETAAEKQLTEGLTRVGLAQVCTECRIYSPL